MAYSAVTLPLTGAGDVTAAPACDVVGGFAYQAMKLMDGTEGSTTPVPALGTTPGSTDHGLVVRPIGSTAHAQAVVGAVGITSGSSAVELTSAGSTRLVGQVTVANQTTSVSLSSAIGITSGSSEVALTSAGSTRLVGQVTVANPTTSVSLSSAIGITSGSSAHELTSAGSTRLVGRVTIENPSTVVELSSAGSTRSVGTINQGTPAASSADAWWVRTVTTGSAGGSTSVDLSSGGSTRLVGTINQGGPAGTSADAWWVRSVTTGSAGGSTTIDLGSGGSTKVVGTVNNATSTAQIGSVALASGTTGTMGAMAQGPGSSANYWNFQPIGFTSALTSRTTVNTSAQASVSAGSTTILAQIIQNLTTVDVGLGLSTAAPTTALANVDLIMSGRNVAGGGSYLVFGMGFLPLFTGNIRGITVGSTVVSGGVVVTRFLSS